MCRELGGPAPHQALGPDGLVLGHVALELAGDARHLARVHQRELQHCVALRRATATGEAVRFLPKLGALQILLLCMVLQLGSIADSMHSSDEGT